jgi:hypothetical protein
MAIVADVIASLEKNAVIQTKGEPDGRPYLMEKKTPSPKKRPLSDVLDEIESRISPEIRNLSVRNGEIVEKGDTMTRKNARILPLTPSIVRGLFTISIHADCLYDDYSVEDRDGTHELGEACDYLKKMIAWYRSKNEDFDVLQMTEGETP